MVTPAHVTEQNNRSELGFWLYLMTDCMLFASLFAIFAVLRSATASGPSGSDIFELPLVLTETIILLVSSLSSGLAILAIKSKRNALGLWLLSVTFALGIAFLVLELSEFSQLISEGSSWQQSAFLSAFFVLVGTHGAHIVVGLIWLGTMMVRVSLGNLTHKSLRQLQLFSMYWHFLDLIWIFIFTIVYLLGVLV